MLKMRPVEKELAVREEMPILNWAFPAKLVSRLARYIWAKIDYEDGPTILKSPKYAYADFTHDYFWTN